MIVSLLVLVVATVMSLQLLMMMDRKSSWRQRLQALGFGGDGLILLFVSCLMGAALGAVAGSALGPHTGVGAGVSGAVGLACWVIALLWPRKSARANTRPPEHRAPR